MMTDIAKLDALQELKELLAKTEVSGSGYAFRPNIFSISSCRVMDCPKFERIIKILDIIPEPLEETDD